MSIRSSLRKKWCAAAFIVIFFPLLGETLRNQNKRYFDSVQWEELQDYSVTPIPEAYTIENNQPIPYTDTLDDGDIYPSLPQLGVLDYQNISDDVLLFLDGIAASFLKKSFDSALFVSYKPFLPHFSKFLLERLPALSYVFYSRPSFQQDGTVSAQFRLTVTQQNAQQSSGTAEPAAENTEKPAETIAAPQKDDSGNQTGIVSTGDDTDQIKNEETADASEIIPLFAEDQLPLFIIVELMAAKEDGTWKMSYMDIRGAEYADSADAD